MNLKIESHYYGWYRLAFSLFLLLSWLWDLPYSRETYGNVFLVSALAPLWIIPFAIGWNRQIFAGIGAFSLLVLGVFSPDVRSPETNFIFFQFAIWALLPEGELKWKGPYDPHWKMNLHALQVYSWFVGLAHFIAGVSKLFSKDTSWVDGTGMQILLETSPWVDASVAQLLLKLPSFILVSANYFAVGSEIVGGLLFFHRKTRQVGFVTLFALHLGSFFVFQLPQVSAALLFCLLFFKPIRN